MSKHKREKWGPHSHCEVCGKAIPEGERFCSPKCQREYEERVRKQRRLIRVLYLSLAVLVLSYVGVILWRGV